MQQIGIIGAHQAAAEFGQALAQQQALDQIHWQQLLFLLNEVPAEVLGTPGCVLVCDSEAQQQAFRPLLDAMGLDYIGTRVAAPTPIPQKWTPEMAAAKEAAGRKLYRHHRGPANTPPTTKARKAARKRAKAGRKASR